MKTEYRGTMSTSKTERVCACVCVYITKGKKRFKQFEYVNIYLYMLKTMWNILEGRRG